MTTLLVTGGAGFIGANFVHYWLARRTTDRVVVLDSLARAGNLENLAPAEGIARFRFVRGDICDRSTVAQLLAEESIDRIVHFAAESHVDLSIADPEAFIRTNVTGTYSLLESARLCWSTGGRFRDGVRFHHVSTDEVFGALADDDSPFSEATRYAPNSPYAATKAASDHLVRAYSRTYGLPVSASNCSNNYGPLQFPEKLVPLMIVRALTGGEMPVYGRGENVRDWLFVRDHCAALEAILDRGREGETYLVGGASERRNIDVVLAICRLLEDEFRLHPELAVRFPACPAARGGHVDRLIRFVPDRWGHDRRYAVDARKLRGELGVVPAVDFESGLRQTVRWYLDNEGWWRRILSGEYRAVCQPQ